MIKLNKSVMLMVMLLGVLFTATVSTANAQDRCRSRIRPSSSSYYGNNYDSRYDDRNYDNRSYSPRSNRDYYYNDEDTTGKAVRRTGIGAGIGALGGAVIGGKKGALIGAGIGAAGGYIYHREKVNRQRDRGWW